MKTIQELYEAYIYENKDFEDREYFYGFIPKTYREAVEYAISNFDMKVNQKKIETLKKFLIDFHNDLGLLTPKVKENINSLDQGVVIAGQQTTIFGGSGIIANKIATTVHMSELSEELGKKLVPVFWVNSHDGIQPEITNIHLPVKQSGESKTISLPTKHDGVAIHTLSTQDFDWLERNLSIIKNNFLEFRSFVAKENRRLFLEQIEHIVTFLRETYRGTLKMSDWITLIWGIQSNIFNDYGVVFVPSSHPKIRELVFDAYLPMLKRRKQYIEEFNRATEKIEKMGLKPTTAKKAETYAPFFLECPNDHYRITLEARETEEGIVLEGTCPIDKYQESLQLDLTPESLRKYAHRLSPRLDTNQEAIQSIIPAYIRVSGPGEINYNAQVIPAARAIGIKLPLYVKYTRLLHNNPWIEAISKNKKIGEHSLFDEEFFKIIGGCSRAKRKNIKEEIVSYSVKLRDTILKKMEELKQIKTPASSPISIYKSWQFGMYDRYHNWQEVSWPWFIQASVTGLTNYLRVYRKFYAPESMVGGIGYINSQL